jgi:hypothetical protein
MFAAHRWKPLDEWRFPRVVDAVYIILCTKPNVRSRWQIGGTPYGCYRSSDTLQKCTFPIGQRPKPEWVMEEDTPEGKVYAVEGYPLVRDIPCSLAEYQEKEIEFFIGADIPLCPMYPCLLMFHEFEIRDTWRIDRETSINPDDRYALQESEFILVGEILTPQEREEMNACICKGGWCDTESPIIYQGGMAIIPTMWLYPDNLREQWTGFSLKKHEEQRKREIQEYRQNKGIRPRRPACNSD